MNKDTPGTLLQELKIRGLFYAQTQDYMYLLYRETRGFLKKKRSGICLQGKMEVSNMEECVCFLHRKMGSVRT
jgi:hypothetical protein